MQRNKLLYWAPAFLFLVSCHSNKDVSDASGTFEATEVIVSAQATGPILAFNIEEGQDLKAGVNLGFIDTIQLDLRKKQLQASIQAAQTRKPDVEVQVAIGTAAGRWKRPRRGFLKSPPAPWVGTREPYGGASSSK